MFLEQVQLADEHRLELLERGAVERGAPHRGTEIRWHQHCGLDLISAGQGHIHALEPCEGGTTAGEEGAEGGLGCLGHGGSVAEARAAARENSRRV